MIAYTEMENFWVYQSENIYLSLMPTNIQLMTIMRSLKIASGNEANRYLVISNNKVTKWKSNELKNIGHI